MKTKRIISLRTFCLLMAPALFILAGCSTQKNVWGDTETGLILEYRMPANQSLMYHQSADHNQHFSVMGQEMSMEIKEILDFTSVPGKTKDGITPLNITIDSMYMLIVHSKGEIIPDLSSIIGQDFSMSLSNMGDESELEEASEIWYDIATGERENLGTKFSSLFPGMPDKPIKIGDEWITYDTISRVDETKNFTISFINTYTFEGLETVGSYDCIKAVSTSTGKIYSKTIAEEMELITDMDITADGTLYFAYKEGLLVKETSKAHSKGEIATPKGAIPIVRDIDMETRLLK